MRPHVCLVAAEASGDALGADLIDALRAADPGVRLSGVGGEKMNAKGVSSTIDMSGLAVLGLIDGLKAFVRVKRKVAEIADEIVRLDPDAVVLIDSWGTMWRLARELKLRGARARRIKLIGPQVWATRRGRARVLAQWCDHLLCIHAFEQPFYARWGLPTTVIGNPALGRLARGDGAAFRKTHGLAPNQPVIGLLPGSRPSEIRRVAPVLIEAARRLCEGRPERKVLCVAAPSIAPHVQAAAAQWAFPHLIVTDEAAKADAFAAMDLALACSGTVTTELAEQGVPIVVGYRLGWITWAIARLFLMRARFITLLNVAAGEEVAPEFVQTRFTPANVVRAAERLLSNPKALETQRRRQAVAIKEMAGSGRPAAEISAEVILSLAAQ
ncbi:MAG: lipid-A-disaccharide synthase [Alphaproteobacteria bacterium]